MVRFFLSVLSVLGFSFSKVGQSTTLKQTGFNFQQSHNMVPCIYAHVYVTGQVQLNVHNHNYIQETL